MSGAQTYALAGVRSPMPVRADPPGDGGLDEYRMTNRLWKAAAGGSCRRIAIL